MTDLENIAQALLKLHRNVQYKELSGVTKHTLTIRLGDINVTFEFGHSQNLIGMCAMEDFV